MAGMADADAGPNDVIYPWEPGKPATKQILRAVLQDAQYVQAGEAIRFGGKRSVLLNKNDQPVSGRIIVLGEELYNAVMRYVESLP